MSAADGASTGKRSHHGSGRFGQQHRSGRGGGASASEMTGWGSARNTGRSGSSSSSSSYYGGGSFSGGGGGGEEDLRLRRNFAGSGRPIISSMFATTPVSSDFPRKNKFTWDSLAEDVEEDEEKTASVRRGDNPGGG